MRKFIFVFRVFAIACAMYWSALTTSVKADPMAQITNKKSSSAPPDFKGLIKDWHVESQAPQNDPVRTLASPATLAPGTLLYNSYIPFKGDPPAYWTHYIVVRSLAATLDKSVVQTLYLDVHAPLWVFDPQFSPDGRKVLFKYGNALDTTHGTYAFFIWDRQIGQLQPGPQKNLNVQQLTWSPDSTSIAYFDGGTWDGQDTTRLFVLNLKTRADRYIAAGVDTALSWTNKNELLYSAAPPKQTNAATANNAPYITNIYEANPVTGQSHLLIADAAQPNAAPNGKWLLFTGRVQPAQPPTRQDNADGEAMQNHYATCLFDMVRKQRCPFLTDLDLDTKWFWMPDSKQLIAFEWSLGNRSHATISLLDLATKPLVTVATAEANFRAPQVPITPTVAPLMVTPDGKFLLISALEISGMQPNDLAAYINVLSAVDLTTGAISTVAEVENSAVAWHGR